MVYKLNKKKNHFSFRFNFKVWIIRKFQSSSKCFIKLDASQLTLLQLLCSKLRYHTMLSYSQSVCEHYFIERNSSFVSNKLAFSYSSLEHSYRKYTILTPWFKISVWILIVEMKSDPNFGSYKFRFRKFLFWSSNAKKYNNMHVRNKKGNESNNIV